MLKTGKWIVQKIGAFCVVDIVVFGRNQRIVVLEAHKRWKHVDIRE